MTHFASQGVRFGRPCYCADCVK